VQIKVSPPGAEGPCPRTNEQSEEFFSEHRFLSPLQVPGRFRTDFLTQVALRDLGARDETQLAEPAHLVNVDPEVGAHAHEAVRIGRRELVVRSRASRSG